MYSSVRGSPAGTPSMMTVSALPCDSPAGRERSALLAAGGWGGPAGGAAPPPPQPVAPAQGVHDLGRRPLLPVHLAGQLAADVRRQDANALGRTRSAPERPGGREAGRGRARPLQHDAPADDEDDADREDSPLHAASPPWSRWLCERRATSRRPA